PAAENQHAGGCQLLYSAVSFGSFIMKSSIKTVTTINTASTIPLIKLYGPPPARLFNIKLTICDRTSAQKIVTIYFMKATTPKHNLTTLYNNTKWQKSIGTYTRKS